MKIYEFIKNLLSFVSLWDKPKDSCPNCDYVPKKHNLSTFHSKCLIKFNALDTKRQNKIMKKYVNSLDRCPYCEKRVKMSNNKINTRCGNCGIIYN